MLCESFEPYGGWKYFHITPKDLGSNIILTPRIPINALKYSDSEDFTTPRVCLAPSFRDAVMGRFSRFELAQDEMFIYASKQVSNIYYPKKSPFKTHYVTWQQFAKSNGIDPSEQSRAQYLLGCVEDVESTNEVWSLKPIKMTQIGRTWMGNDNRLKLKWNLRQTYDTL